MNGLVQVNAMETCRIAREHGQSQFSVALAVNTLRRLILSMGVGPRMTPVGLLRAMSVGSAALISTVLFVIGPAFAESRNLAPGFTNLPASTRVVLMPVDIELFSISAGGVAEPKADWTQAASNNFKSALLKKQGALGVALSELTESDADAFTEINALHGAVARAIAIHHFGSSVFKLPTKEGKLDWSLGEEVNVIKAKTGADYALFCWIRDSYSSKERVAAMVVMAMLGVGIGGGVQTGYASLVDLNTGRILWFNRLSRGHGDLREEDRARETANALLENFPVAK